MYGMVQGCLSRQTSQSIEVPVPGRRRSALVVRSQLFQEIMDWTFKGCKKDNVYLQKYELGIHEIATNFQSGLSVRLNRWTSRESLLGRRRLRVLQYRMLLPM